MKLVYVGLIAASLTITSSAWATEVENLYKQNQQTMRDLLRSKVENKAVETSTIKGHGETSRAARELLNAIDMAAKTCPKSARDITAERECEAVLQIAAEKNEAYKEKYSVMVAGSGTWTERVGTSKSTAAQPQGIKAKVASFFKRGNAPKSGR